VKPSSYLPFTIGAAADPLDGGKKRKHETTADATGVAEPLRTVVVAAHRWLPTLCVLRRHTLETSRLAFGRVQRARAGTGNYLERQEVKSHKLDHVRLVSRDGVGR
jgi:hypothetical protein